MFTCLQLVLYFAHPAYPSQVLYITWMATGAARLRRGHRRGLLDSLALNYLATALGVEDLPHACHVYELLVYSALCNARFLSGLHLMRKRLFSRMLLALVLRSICAFKLWVHIGGCIFGYSACRSDATAR